MKILHIILYLSIFTACSNRDTDLCGQLKFIQTIPFKGEQINDYVYNGLIKQGLSVAPCLIDNITNTNIMIDPRQMASYINFREGDLAVFILLDITNEKLKNFLPDKEKEKFITEGIWVYFDYVAKNKNRIELQNKWKRWNKKSRGERE